MGVLSMTVNLLKFINSDVEAAIRIPIQYGLNTPNMHAMNLRKINVTQPL